MLLTCVWYLSFDQNKHHKVHESTIFYIYYNEIMSNSLIKNRICFSNILHILYVYILQLYIIMRVGVQLRKIDVMK